MNLSATMARRAAALAACVLALSACAVPPRQPQGSTDGAEQLWSGRLALSVAAQPPQNFSAAFELRGMPVRGELALYTPLGSTAALVSWSPQRALLRAQGQPEQAFDSLDALIEQLTGAAIPVPALFDWLAGRPTPVAGWEADLSRQADGRVQARRISPPPAAELRIVLDHR